ncbi:MAG: AbrB/MazE/SpoVT family DNA-binding domain-containing protein [Thermoproteota archaeon]
MSGTSIFTLVGIVSSFFWWRLRAGVTLLELYDICIVGSGCEVFLWVLRVCEGKIFICGLKLGRVVWAVATQVVKSDDRGRITIPSKIRKDVGLDAGAEVEVKVEGDRVILSPLTGKRGEKLSEILGGVYFNRKARRKGERWLLERSRDT